MFATFNQPRDRSQIGLQENDRARNLPRPDFAPLAFGDWLFKLSLNTCLSGGLLRGRRGQRLNLRLPLGVRHSLKTRQFGGGDDELAQSGDEGELKRGFGPGGLFEQGEARIAPLGGSLHAPRQEGEGFEPRRAERG